MIDCSIRKARAAGPFSTVSILPLRALSRARVLLLLAFVAVTVLGVVDARAGATTYLWDGGGADGNWTNSVNWDRTIATGNNSVLAFAGTVRTTNTNNFTEGSTFNSILFNTGAGAFSLFGNGINLNNSLGIVNNSSVLQTISLSSINFNNAASIITAETGDLRIESNLSGAATSLNIDAGNAARRVTLSGSNSFTGSTTVLVGILRIENSFALGSTNAGTIIGDNEVLELAGNIDVQGESLSIRGDGPGTGALLNVSGTNTWSGPITLTGGAVTFGSTEGLLTLSGGITTDSRALITTGAGDILISGPIALNVASVTKNGTGMLTLSGANGYSTATAVNAGVLRIANDTALGTVAGGVTVANLAALELSNNITVGAEALSINGAGIGGTGALRNVHGTNTYGGAITFATAATIEADANTQLNLTNMSGNVLKTFDGPGNIVANGVIAGTTVTKTGTGTLILAAANTFNGALTVQSGTLSIGAINNNNTAGTLGQSTVAVILGATGGSTGELLYTGGTTNSTKTFSMAAGGSGAFNVSNSATALTLSGVITNTGTLVKRGAGTLILSGANTYSGGTTINEGTLAIGSANERLANTGAVTVDGASAVFDIGTFSEAVGAVTLTDGSITGSSGTLTGTSYAVQNGSISAILAGGATVTMTKTGAGTVTLSGANTYSGATTIGGGTLSVSADNNLGSAPGAATSGQLTMSNGGTLAVTTGFTLNSNRGIALGAGGGVFDVASGQALSYGGIIAGANTLTKNGLGTLTLSGASAYANTTVNAGTLNINNANALGNLAGTLTLGDGVTINNTSGGTITVLNQKSISIGSSLNFLGSDSLNLGVGTVTFSTNTTIDVAANVLRFDGDVLGSGLGLTKTGAGTLEFHGLTGSNSYTGNTFINGGKLFLSGTSVFGGTTNTTVTVASNAFLEIGTSASVGNVTVVSRPDGWINNATNVITADIVYDQSGTLTANNANYNGTTTIESGVTISTAEDFFGVVPTNAVADRIILQDNATLQATATFDIEANQGVQLTSGTGTISSAGASTALFVNSVVSGSGELRKTGSGNIRLLGTNTYTGGTVIDQGIIGIVSDASLGDVSGRLKLNGGSVVAAQTISGPTNSGTTIDASRDLVLGNGTTSGLQAQTGLNLTYNGVITEEGAGAAANVFIGTAGPRAGTVTLGGLNTFQGTTTLNAGILEVANLANGGQASGLGQSGNAAVNLVLNSGTLRFTGASASTDRLFTVGGPAVTLDTGAGSLAFTNSGSLLFSSTNVSSQITLSGAGAGELAAAIADASGSNATSLAKSGAGTWTLSGNGSFTGGTFLNEGTLRLAGASSAGLGSITQNNGFSTLVVDTSGTVANQMNVYNVTTLQTVTLSGDKTLFNATYNVTNNTTTTESGTLTGDGGITKTGTGTLLVTGDNTFDGPIDVQAGVLNLASSTGSAAGLTASISVGSSATLLISQSNQVNDAATVSLSGGTIQRGAGVSEVFGALTVTGSGFLEFGATSYGNAGTISFGTYTPSALLTINNFDYGSTLTFGSNLTSTINNSSFFSFSNGGIASSSWDEETSTFTITAIPEPSTYLAAAGLLGLMLWPSRRRILAGLKSRLGLGVS